MEKRRKDNNFISFTKYFDNHPAVILIIKPETGDIVYANKTAESFYGWQKSKLEKMKIFDINLLSAKQIKQNMDLVKNQKKHNFIFQHRLSDGSIRFVEVLSSPIEIEGKKYLYSIINDITDKRKAEELLKESEEKYRKIFNNDKLAMILVDYETQNIIDVNPAAEKIYGWSKEEFKKLKISYINTLGTEETIKRMKELKENHVSSLEFVHRRKDGSVFDVEIVRIDIKVKGRDVFWLVIKDISESKKLKKELEESEKRLKVITDSARDAIIMIDDNDKIVFWNKAAEDIFGYKKKDVMGQYLHKTIVPDYYLEKFKKGYKNFIKTGKGKAVNNTVDLKGLNKSGQQIDVSLSISAVKVKNRWHAVGIVRDETKQKRIEKELEKSKELYKFIAENTADTITVLDLNLNYLYISPSVKNSLGYTPEEIYETGLKRALTMESLKKVNKLLDEEIKLEKSGKADPKRSRIIKLKEIAKDGRELVIENTVSFLRDSKGKAIGILSISRDITEREKILRLLKESEEKYRSAFQTSPDSITISSLEGEYIDVNEGFLKTTGYKREEVIGKTVQALNIWKNKKDRDMFVRELKEKGVISNLEMEFYGKNRKVLIGLLSARIIEINNKKRILTITRDITERRKIEKEIEKEKERLAVSLRSIGDGVIATDREGNILLLNKVAEKLTGWKQKEVEGKKLSEVFRVVKENTGEMIEDLIKRIVNTGKILEIPNHSVLISKNGRKINISDSGAPIKDKDSKIVGVIIVFRDITERQKLIEASQRNQKLEALGILAGGIAHDFNNLLTGIFGYIDMSLKKSENEYVKKYLTKTISTIDKARNLTNQLLTFSKGGMPVKKADYLFPFIKNTVDFILSGSNIKAVYDVEDDLWACEYDKNQIGQVIDNIIINAKQAMPFGGTIYIKAENISNINEKLKFLEKKKYIKITIKDEGIGIADKILSHIFDPFFTTKEKGHGLGLAISHSIISKHGGEILVESEQGVGTSFYIYLPASKKRVKNMGKTYQQKHLGEGTILIMDDEDILRDTLKDMLENFGYNVITTKKGEEVIEYFRDMKEKSLKAIILDLTVSNGMGGKDTIQKIREINQQIPVFVASGYASDPILAEPEKYGFTASIKKPFLMTELSEILTKYIKQ